MREPGGRQIGGRPQARVVSGVLLEPLPYREPERLVMLWETTKDVDRIMVSYQNFVDWRARQRGFEDIAVYNQFQSFSMTGQGDAERVRGGYVTANLYHMLGVRPALGRLINVSDDTPGAASSKPACCDQSTAVTARRFFA